jgi:predicted lactoylglutathione lyase
MPNRQIYVNLPVKDLERSKAFFTALGFAFNPRFSDANAGCLVISDSIYAMLLAEPFFRTFTTKQIVDTRTSIEVLLALSCETRAEVDAMVEKAVAAGGRLARDAKDHGFMFERAFEDPDGHTWEVFWMDPNAAPPHP